MNKENIELRGLIGALAGVRLNGEVRQMLDAVVYLSLHVQPSLLFSPAADQVVPANLVTLPARRIRELTQLSDVGVCRARNELEKMNIVAVEQIDKGTWAYRLQRDASMWRVPPIKTRATTKGKKGIYGEVKRVIQKAFTKKREKCSIPNSIKK